MSGYRVVIGQTGEYWALIGQDVVIMMRPSKYAESEVSQDQQDGKISNMLNKTSKNLHEDP